MAMVDIKIGSLKSELYALIETINQLNSKFQKGLVSNKFYAKSIKRTYNSLFSLNLKIKESGSTLCKLLDEMKYVGEYQTALKILDNIAEVDKLTDSDKFNLSVLDLPNIALQITSSLITLMDIIKLGIFKNFDLVDKSFKDLTTSFAKFPGMENLKDRISNLWNNTIENKSTFINNTKFRDNVGEKLYAIFGDFQEKLNNQSP